MTSAHILYIPTIFILGFVSGLLIKGNSNPKISNGEDSDINSRLRFFRIILLISFIVFLIVFVGTHFFEIPRSSKAVVKALNGQEIFDKKPSYSSAEVYSRISSFPQNGLKLYQEFTYTIDMLFPLTFFVFLFLLAKYVGERSAPKKSIRHLLFIFPVLWFISDMIENVSIYHLIAILPQRNYVLAGVLGYVTIIKFTLLFLSLLSPAIVLSFSKRKNRNFKFSKIN